MKNIFDGAEFGDSFKTRSGKLAIFGQRGIEHHTIISRDDDGIAMYSVDNNGKVHPNKNNSNDIISQWEELIDEDELEKLAEKSEMEHIQIAKQCASLGQCYGFGYKEGFKDGYKKAKH